MAEEPEEAAALATTLRSLGQVLGLLYQDPERYLQSNPILDQLQLDHIADQVKERELARSNKEWERADIIRAWLEEHGVELEDKDGKTHWKVK